MTYQTMKANAELDAAMIIVNKALSYGYTISVNDGEEWTVKRSTDAHQVRCALQSTDSDTMRFRNTAGEIIGTVWFVWGNSPHEVAADWSDNQLTNELLAECIIDAQ